MADAEKTVEARCKMPGSLQTMKPYWTHYIEDDKDFWVLHACIPDARSKRATVQEVFQLYRHFEHKSIMDACLVTLVPGNTFDDMKFEVQLNAYGDVRIVSKKDPEFCAELSQYERMLLDFRS
jgi:hypothetical protein